MKRGVLSVLAGIVLLFMVPLGYVFGILSDKDVERFPYTSTAGEVGIDLSVETDSDEAIQIVPDQVTTLRINAVNTGTIDCYIFIKLDIPEMNGHPILAITPTGNWQKVDTEGLVYQYVVDGLGRELEAGMTTPEMVAEARFYDFEQVGDFDGELVVSAYAIQTSGFDDSQPADIWNVALEAEGE